MVDISCSPVREHMEFNVADLTLSVSSWGWRSRDDWFKKTTMYQN